MRWPRSNCRFRPASLSRTRVCTYFYAHGGKYPAGLKEGVAKSVARIEKAMGRRFGDAHNPLLVSVRSGARVSMPGMMDTVLNLGLTDETVKGLEAASQNARFAWDSYRRFCQMYGDVVLKLKPKARRSRSIRGADRSKEGAARRSSRTSSSPPTI